MSLLKQFIQEVTLQDVANTFNATSDFYDQYKNYSIDQLEREAEQLRNKIQNDSSNSNIQATPDKLKLHVVEKLLKQKQKEPKGGIGNVSGSGTGGGGGGNMILPAIGAAGVAAALYAGYRLYKKRKKEREEKND